MYLQLTRAYVDDLKIHDLADPAMVYSLKSVARQMTERRVVQPRVSRDGIVDRSVFKAEQTLDIAGYSWGVDDGTAQENHDQLTARFATSGDHVFRFLRLGRVDEEQITFRTAVAPAALSEGYSRTVRWATSIVGADPRIFSAALKTGTYDPTASLSGGGVTMPMPMPLTFSATTVTELFVTNGGTYPTPPTLTIHGPVAQPIIDNDTTGLSIYLNATLGIADVVVIDVGARTLLLNGASRKDLFNASLSVWFELVKGVNALRLRGSGMSAGVTSLTAQYRDARV